LTFSPSCFNIYYVNVEATWTHSGPGGGTQQLHQMYIGIATKCTFDGAEIGSTGVKMTWSLPDGLVSANKLNANNNFAPTAYALAA
jgi:hypothetical protein